MFILPTETPTILTSDEDFFLGNELGKVRLGLVDDDDGVAFVDRKDDKELKIVYYIHVNIL